MEGVAKLNIYLVDDDKFCLNLYEQHLLNLGVEEIRKFETGYACLEQLIIEKPDIVFLDHYLPDCNGLEVLDKIKRFNPDIFVVFLTSQENVQVAVNALKYGAFDYIMKGDKDMDSMTAVIKKIIHIINTINEKRPGFWKKFIL